MSEVLASTQSPTGDAYLAWLHESRERPEALRASFRQLADEWRAATRHLSSTTAIATHPAYQRIIGMGPPAVPLILDELQRENDHWYWALVSITGENPVAEPDRGRLTRMRDIWLEWGRQRKLIGAL